MMKELSNKELQNTEGGTWFDDFVADVIAAWEGLERMKDSL